VRRSHERKSLELVLPSGRIGQLNQHFCGVFNDWGGILGGDPEKNGGGRQETANHKKLGRIEKSPMGSLFKSGYGS